MATEVENARTDAQPARSLLRIALLWCVPFLLCAGGYWFYATHERYATTDNAYVKSDKTIVRAEVAANVLAVFVHENEEIAAGTPLMRLDDSTLRLAVAHARAELAAVSTDLRALSASYTEKATELEVARRDAAFADRDLERERELAARKLVAQAALDGAERATEVAHGRVAVLEGALAQIRVSLSGNPSAPIEEHPRVRAAAAALAQAELDLEHADIIAPRHGIVSHLPQPGDRLEVGTPAAAIVADSNPWIEANFKETEVAGLVPGQKVAIEIDSYPGRDWHGHVESIAQATGAEFALLPPQNATGNWVKVVQRIPVRIAIDASVGDPPLRAGMSANVRIDTRQPVQATTREARAAP